MVNERWLQKWPDCVDSPMDRLTLGMEKLIGLFALLAFAFGTSISFFLGEKIVAVFKTYCDREKISCKVSKSTNDRKSRKQRAWNVANSRIASVAKKVIEQQRRKDRNYVDLVIQDLEELIFMLKDVH